MEKFKFEFGDFQDDGVGGVFPLFTVIHKFDAHPILIYKTTLSGNGLFKQGFNIPSYHELKKYAKGDIVELEYRKAKNIPFEDKVLN